MKSQKKANFLSAISVLCALTILAAVFSGLPLSTSAATESSDFIDTFDSISDENWEISSNITAKEIVAGYSDPEDKAIKLTGTAGIDYRAKNTMLRKTDSPEGDRFFEAEFDGLIIDGLDDSAQIKSWGAGIIARATTDDNGNINGGYLLLAKMCKNNWYEDTDWIGCFKINSDGSLSELKLLDISSIGCANNIKFKLQLKIEDSDSAAALSWELLRKVGADWTTEFSDSYTDNNSPIRSGKSGFTVMSYDGANAPIIELYRFADTDIPGTIKYDIKFDFVKNGTVIDTKTVTCKQGEIPEVPSAATAEPDAEYHYTEGAWNEAVTEALSDKTYTYTYTAEAHTGNETCTEPGTCSVCGYEIPAHGHKFTNYISNNDATYEADGTKTASCDYNCGATDKVTDEGSKLIKGASSETETGNAGETDSSASDKNTKSEIPVTGENATAAFAFAVLFIAAIIGFGICIKIKRNKNGIKA